MVERVIRPIKPIAGYSTTSLNSQAFACLPVARLATKIAAIFVLNLDQLENWSFLTKADRLNLETQN